MNELDNFWGFKANKSKEDPYETILPKLNPCTPAVFNSMSTEQ